MTTKTTNFKKVISILLSILMLITMLPLSAFAVEEYNEIKLGEPYTVTEAETVKFVPAESGIYIIRSVSDVDPKVFIYNSDMKVLHIEGDSNYGENGDDFYYEYEYTAGETYYFVLEDLYGIYNYTVYLFSPCIEHTGGTQTCKGYRCDTCGEWYGEAGDHATTSGQTCKGYKCDTCGEWYGEAGDHIDEDGKGLCDVCDEFLGNEIKLGDTYNVTKGEYVKFVPAESGKFIIRSVSDVDPRVTIYNSNMEELHKQDDSNYGENGDDFYYEYEYTAGETYYFEFYDYRGKYNYTVYLFSPCIEHTGGTQTCKGYRCDTCGEWYGEAGDHATTSGQTCVGYKCDTCGEWYGEGTGNHVDENVNDFCDVCNEFLYTEIKAGEPYTVTEREYVKFVPTESGIYIIRSVSDVDPKLYVYNSNMKVLHQEDNSDYGDNVLDFYFEYEYTAGETYYFEFNDYREEYNYTVYLFSPCIEHTGGTQTCKGYRCEVCYEWYGEAGEHINEDGNVFCDICDEFLGNEIKVDEPYTVTKEEYVKFVPAKSGIYIIRSVSDVDPRVTICDSDMLPLHQEDDSYYRENGYDFYYGYEYTAGETYYFQFVDSRGEYNYTVYLTSPSPCIEHTGGTQTCKGYKCEVCYEWYGEGTGDHVDEDGNAFCDVCNEFIGNEIKAGDTYTVTKYEYVKFVPAVSGIYIIRSVSDVDPRVIVYNSNMEELDGEDDSNYREENYRDFYSEYEYTAGETYYFEFDDYRGEYNYTVYLTCTEHTGGTATCVSGKICEACGEEYGEIDENNHTGGTATCVSSKICDRCKEAYGEADPYTHVGNYEPEYQWYPEADGTCYVSATLYCADCGEYVDGASDYATQTGSVEATDCQNPGSVTYSITLTMNGKEYTATETYPVESDNHVGEFDNGFCSVCGGYEKPETQQGEYEWETIYLIDNAGKLFWFADYINNVTNEANALVTKDITIPEGKEWTPIMNFYGTFDGGFNTISGLNCVSDGEQVGMFGGGSYSYGTIKNVHITNSHFEGTNYVGALAGYHAGEIRNCYVDNVTVKGENNTGALVGNLAGYMYNCFAFADSLIGSYNSNYAIVENSYYLAEAETTDGGKTAEQFANGEVAYLLQAGILGEDLYDEETGEYIGTTEPEHIWGQSIGTENYPVFKGDKVYKNQIGGCCEENYVYGYANTEKEAVTSHIYDENGACVCGDLNYFVIGQMAPQVRFGKNDDGSYAHTFDIRTRAKITDEDFKRFVGETNEEAIENVKKVGFVYSRSSDKFSIEDAKKVAQGEKIEGYADAPVSYVQDADGYYMFTCIVINVPDTDIDQELVSFAYICVEIDGVEYWYFMDAIAQADFNDLYTRCIPLACEAYGWESFGDYEAHGDGIHTGTCAICGETETGDCVYDKYVSNDDRTHNVVCSLCGHISTTENCNFENDNTCPCGQKRVGSFTVSDLISFGDGWNNEVDLESGGGTLDAGKTAWEEGDVVFVAFTSQKCGTQTAELTYNGNGEWSTDAYLYYLKDETPTINAIYAPCYEVTTDGKLQLKDDMQLGMKEYLTADCEIVDRKIDISFEGSIRDYSRLRIVGLPNQTLTVTTTGFTPAGATEMATEPYTFTTDSNGNAFLYGTFAEGATVSVKKGDIALKDYTFTAEKNPNGTEHNKSYVLDARPIIDGTLGGKTTATDDDINALVVLLKTYVDNGLTTIIVTGETPATITVNNVTTSAIGEAFYRLGEDDSYNGTIDLILSDVTELAEWEFCYAHSLNSITLPKVTKMGDCAFQGCTYLRRITFGSVVTEGAWGSNVFDYVGDEVGGCDLYLNKEQENADGNYRSEASQKYWMYTWWKSITLT